RLVRGNEPISGRTNCERGTRLSDRARASPTLLEQSRYRLSAQIAPFKQSASRIGGGRGIRTPGTLPGTVVFKTTAIDHSAIPPRRKSRRKSRDFGVRDFAQHAPYTKPHSAESAKSLSARSVSRARCHYTCHRRRTAALTYPLPLYRSPRPAEIRQNSVE